MQRIYALYDAFDPKWFPAFVLLQRKLSITEIAQIIGHSPISQSDCQRNDEYWAWLHSKSVSDARVNVVKLSDRGQQLIPTIKKCIDVTQAAEELVEEMQYDLWKAIEEMEFFERKDFYTRVRENVKPWKPTGWNYWLLTWVYEDFKRLNYEWIENTSNWNWPSVVKPPVRENFATWWAYFNGTLHWNRRYFAIKTDDTYELAKMAVTERARGKTLVGCLGRLLLMLLVS